MKRREGASTAMMTQDRLSKCRNTAIVVVVVTGVAYNWCHLDQKIASWIIMTFWLLVQVAITAEAILHKEISLGGETVTKRDHPRGFRVVSALVFIADVLVALPLLHALAVL